jgi:hypothetical protein
MATDTCEQCGTQYAIGAPRCPHCSSTQRLPEGALKALVPSVTVACDNNACTAKGVERRVGLSQVVPGVLDLPRLICARCGYELPKVTEDIVPKIRVHGGPSNAAADGGGEDVSAGTNSSTSSEKGSTSPKPSEVPSPKRARKTANRSGQARTESSTASGTAGAPEADTSETNSASDAAAE